MRNTGHMRGSRASPADSFIEVDGARLRLRDEGQGFPVLLVHGWALDLDMWPVFRVAKCFWQWGTGVARWGNQLAVGDR